MKPVRKTVGSPTELSLELLRKLGYQAEVVEHFVRQPRGRELGQCPACKQVRRSEETLGYRKDLFGLLDIVALKDGITLGVQTTSASNVSARVAKMRGSVWFEWLKRAGWRLEIHGWGGDRGVRVIDMGKEATEWDSILRNGARSRKRPRVQTGLFG